MSNNPVARARAAVNETPVVSALTTYANNLTEKIVLEAQKYVPQAGVARAAMGGAPR